MCALRVRLFPACASLLELTPFGIPHSVAPHSPPLCRIRRSHRLPTLARLFSRKYVPVVGHVVGDCLCVMKRVHDRGCASAAWGFGSASSIVRVLLAALSHSPCLVVARTFAIADYTWLFVAETADTYGVAYAASNDAALSSTSQHFGSFDDLSHSSPAHGEHAHATVSWLPVQHARVCHAVQGTVARCGTPSSAAPFCFACAVSFGCRGVEFLLCPCRVATAVRTGANRCFVTALAIAFRYLH